MIQDGMLVGGETHLAQKRREKLIIIKSNPPNEQASKGTFLYNLRPSKRTKLKQ
jgi:hypothetical protein